MRRTQKKIRWCEARHVLAGAGHAADGAAVHVAGAATGEVSHWLTPNLAGIKILEKNSFSRRNVATVELGEGGSQQHDSVPVTAELDKRAPAHVEGGENTVGAVIAVEQAFDGVKCFNGVLFCYQLLEA